MSFASPSSAGPNLICFDCDQTLSALEGIDELARLRDASVAAQVTAMTEQAMDGAVPIELVFRRRMELIRPTAAEVDAVGRQYVATAEPTANATIAELKRRGWTPVVVSAGFERAIQPLAAAVGIDRIEAVKLQFDPQGQFVAVDPSSETARSRGKAGVIQRLKRELAASRVVMVGDGANDLEAKPVVDLFVGFGRYVAREKVRAGAHRFITSLHELLEFL